MDHELAGLRRELARVEKGRGRRYPAELRARVEAWAKRRRAAGASWEEIKRELGQKFDTVRRWCREPAASTRAMVRVEVVPERASERLVSIVSPSGFRVDGLSLAEAAVLLHQLQ